MPGFTPSDNAARTILRTPGATSAAVRPFGRRFTARRSFDAGVGMVGTSAIARPRRLASALTALSNRSNAASSSPRNLCIQSVDRSVALPAFDLLWELPTEPSTPIVDQLPAPFVRRSFERASVASTRKPESRSPCRCVSFGFDMAEPWHMLIAQASACARQMRRGVVRAPSNRSARGNPRDVLQQFGQVGRNALQVRELLGNTPGAWIVSAGTVVQAALQGLRLTDAEFVRYGH